MPWYWILLIISLIVGPFDALYLYNKAWKKRQKRKAAEENPSPAQEHGPAESTPPQEEPRPGQRAEEDTKRR